MVFICARGLDWFWCANKKDVCTPYIRLDIIVPGADSRSVEIRKGFQATPLNPHEKMRKKIKRLAIRNLYGSRHREIQHGRQRFFEGFRRPAKR